MANCTNCNKNIGIFSKKYKTNQGEILCEECFIKYKEREDELEKLKKEYNRLQIEEFVIQYLSNKDLTMKMYILECNNNEEIAMLFEENSIKKVIDHFQDMLNTVQYKIQVLRSTREIDGLMVLKKFCEHILVFLNDLEKMYKMLISRNINTTYKEIFSIIIQEIEFELDAIYFNRILNPAYEFIRTKLSNDISTNNVIKEFFRLPLDINKDTQTVLKLLKKFNINVSKEELETIILKVQEEIELEEFEKNKVSTVKMDLGGFEHLNPPEFEEYLEKLFKIMGYTVIKTPLVGDQGADLILEKNGERIVVQAKKYNEKVSNKAIQEIVAAKSYYNATKAMVITNNTFTKGAIELALSNKVELWDGEKLKEVVSNLQSKNKCDETAFEVIIDQKKIELKEKLLIKCPFCHESFEYDLNTNYNSLTLISCPYCTIKLNILIGES